MSVIFSEVDKHFNPEKLNEKARRVYETSKLAASKNYQPDEEATKALGLNDLTAKYKIEIILSTDRSNSKNIVCAMTPFRSGGSLHGGGDEIMYFCRNEKDRDMGCGSILKGPALTGRMGDEQVTVFYCDKCEKYVNRELLGSTILYRLPIKKIAQNAYDLFRKLDSSADIYLKHIKVDMRDATEKGEKGMNLIPKKSEFSIYTLKSIFKDVSNSSQILRKFEDFLSV